MQETSNCWNGFNWKIKIWRKTTTVQILSGNTEKSVFLKIVTRGAVFQNGSIRAKESLFCVFEEAKKLLIFVVQRHFLNKYFKELPRRHDIIMWMKQFEKTRLFMQVKK